jgi:hypothetical protein
MMSLEQGTLYMGDWSINDDLLVLNIWNATTIGGIPMGIESFEITLDLSGTLLRIGCIFFDGESFYLLNSDPLEAIISLVPTYGMTGSEIEAFSTYD